MDEKTTSWLIDYWLEHYCNEVCTICGNSGVIDTTAVLSPTGEKVGRLNWCICPNGVALRRLANGALPLERIWR